MGKGGCVKVCLFLLFTFYFFLSSVSHAENLPNIEGARLFQDGQFQRSANWCVEYLNTHGTSDPNRPATMMLLGQSLEKMAEPMNTHAEKECFRSGKKDGASCMRAYAEKLNASYGAGAFTYNEAVTYIRYTGSHFKQLMNEFPSSPYAAEASYLELSKHLIGNPEQVLPRIKDFMARYPSGEWGRKGRLLWGRINEDIWWIHRKWSWVLYNWKISEEDLIVKAEPYRQEALRTFESLARSDGNMEEGRLAKKEQELLKAYQDDGTLYGITNESNVSGVLVK